MSLHHDFDYDLADAVSAGKKGKTETITFDDLSAGKQGAGPIKAGYDGLDWSNDFGVINPSVALKGGDYAHSGFFTGITSGKQVGFNNQGNPIAFGLPKGTFDLTSMELTAGFDSKMSVGIVAYDMNGKVITQATITINDAKPTLVNFKDLTGISILELDPGKGTTDKKSGGSGSYIVIDDIKVANISGKAATGASLDFHHAAGSAFQTAGHALPAHETAVALHIEPTHLVHPIA